ncbi:hypothetical protein TSA66_15135 [Noviherbaspirillum autotrophicum]|uniref:Uncharacterized protein n=2 Tax=Noviherbaspirillum autotrophicum TaxID=709839 RepID=A0A0C2BP58_9BURK|nr:hypothetical protein TSA66_15135 [Noviherbaspirillum autotrophicum]
MFEPTMIFQRTQAGRDEIYEKQRRLTQSERLVLIMVDGTTSYQGVRSKLPVLTEERFQRALTTLQKKDLILEVFLPVEGQQPEEMAQTVIDRFIQQDATDPLTIISFDPEDDFGVFGPPISMSSSTTAQEQGGTLGLTLRAQMDEKPFISSHGISAPPAASAGLMDESLIEQADALAAEVRAQRPHYANPIEQVRDISAQRRSSSARKPAPSSAPDKSVKLHWGYWMIGVGLAFIVGFVIARLTK